MKTKQLKWTGLLIACFMIILVFTSAFTRQQGVSSILTIDCYLNSSSVMYITDETGNVEKIDFKVNTGNNYPDNSIVLNRKLNEINKKGYRLVSAFGDGLYSQYIFQRDE